MIKDHGMKIGVTSGAIVIAEVLDNYGWGSRSMIEIKPRYELSSIHDTFVD